MAGAVAVLFFLLAVPASYANDYVVGDDSGWSTSTDYNNWTSGKTFTVGDTLLFSYSALHNVAEVNKADYDSCTTNNVVNSYSDGNTSIPLTKAGTSYFVCSTIGHCSQGMKLAVKVTPASTPTPTETPPSSSGPTSPTTPSTPVSSPTSPTTPSTPVSTPTSPTTPSTPVSTPTSTTPSNPTSTTPSNPTSPTISTPNTPSTPTTSSSPATPTTPSTSTTTSSSAMRCFYGIDAMVIGASLLIAPLLAVVR